MKTRTPWVSEADEIELPAHSLLGSNQRIGLVPYVWLVSCERHSLALTLHSHARLESQRSSRSARNGGAGKLLTWPSAMPSLSLS